MLDAKLIISGQEFALPLELLFALTEQFPGTMGYAKNIYEPLADAIIGLNIPALHLGLAKRRSLKQK